MILHSSSHIPSEEPSVSYCLELNGLLPLHGFRGQQDIGVDLHLFKTSPVGVPWNLYVANGLHH